MVEHAHRHDSLYVMSTKSTININSSAPIQEGVLSELEGRVRFKSRVCRA